MPRCTISLHRQNSLQKPCRSCPLRLCIVVGPEANRKRFWSNATLSIMYRIFSKLTKASKDHGHTSYADICLSVNERLVAEGVISSHINSVDMLRLVDIHSPNSGQKIDRDEGFDAVWLRDNYFKPYECTIYYHYSGLPKLIEFINRSVFAASAPKFSLIIKKK